MYVVCIDYYPLWRFGVGVTKLVSNVLSNSSNLSVIC